MANDILGGEGAASSTPDPNGQGGTPAPQSTATPSMLGDEGTSQPGNEGGEPKGQETTQVEDAYKDLKFSGDAGEVDEAFIKDLKGWAKESGVKPEGLQKLVDNWTKAAVQANKKAEAELQKEQSERTGKWFKELESDKEFGGAKFGENRLAAKKALEKFDPKGDFKKHILENKIDNWPPLVKFLAEIGKAAKDDSVAGTTGNGAPPSAINSDAEFHKQMYPTMVKEQ
jgi:hypothetical protein